MNVLHFRDGSTRNFAEPPRIDIDRQIVVPADPGSDVPFSELKAVFFLQDEAGADAESQRAGSFLAVEFIDGELIRGFARYNPELPGFYLFPAENGRNERVFVVVAAVQSIEIEKV